LENGYRAALEVLKEMESRFPHEKEMLFQIGDYSYHAGLLAPAREYFEKVLAMDSTFARAVQHIIWVYGEAGEPQNMLAMAEHYHALEPSEESYILLGKAYMGLGDFEKAITALQRAREFTPRSWQVAQMMAEVYTFQEKFGQAEAELKPYLAKNQPFGVRFSACLSLASIYPYVGKYRETLRLFDQIIEMSWQTHDTAGAVLWHFAKGFYFWEGLKDAKEVKKEIEETLPFQNKLSANVDYWINRIYFHASLGNFALADSLDRAKAELWPQGRAMHLFLLTYLHSLKHECAEAEKSLAEGREAGLPQTIALWNFFYLAQCHFAAGKFDEALKWLQKIPAVYDNNLGNRAVFYPKSFYLLGRIYEQKGDKQAAITNYEKLLELWKDGDKDLPELIDAKARLAKLRGA
jgi:tetratricopeptide (TPR) repeat protein